MRNSHVQQIDGSSGGRYKNEQRRKDYRRRPASGLVDERFARVNQLYQMFNGNHSSLDPDLSRRRSQVRNMGVGKLVLPRCGWQDHRQALRREDRVRRRPDH